MYIVSINAEANVYLKFSSVVASSSAVGLVPCSCVWWQDAYSEKYV